MRCWLSFERTTNPSSRRKRQDSLSLSLVLFPPKPLCWVSAGALLGAVIRTPVLYFLHFCVGVSLTLRLLWLCRNNPARGLFQQKKRLSQSGCFAPMDALFPPAHSAFLALLCRGGITTLGARFMLLKRWTPAGHGGLFSVFAPSRNLPRAGRISPRWVHNATSAPNRAHSGSHAETRGGFPARDIGRVDRVNSSGTLCIVTFGTAQLNEPLAVAAAHHGRDADFP